MPRRDQVLSKSFLVGREREISALDQALERAARGATELIIIDGEAGIGKTRLLETWSSRAAASGALVLQARSEELTRGLSLQPLIDALDGYLRTLPTTDAVLALLGPEHALLAPLLTASPASTDHAAVDPAAGQSLLFAALLSVVTRLTAGAPVVLMLDDLHLADRATIEWLHFITRRRGTMRLLCVGAVRPEEAPLLPVQAQRLALGPLDMDATVQLVGGERAADLHARSGGHPLFLMELAAAEDGTLPASLREAIASRCERAGMETAATLKSAAVLGSRVDVDLLAGVSGFAPLGTLAHLEEGVRRRLLEERDASFVFRHELVREVLAADVGNARRILLHREAARLLAARSRVEPLQVAYHARLGGDDELAANALTQASQMAAMRYDHAESERLLDEAIALSDSASRRLQRARTRNLRRNYRGAEEDAVTAHSLGAGAAAFEVAGWAAYYCRDFADARSYAVDGIRLADRMGDGASRSLCHTLAGRIDSIEGDLYDAEAHLEQSLALASDHMARSAPSAFLAQIRCWQGRPNEALSLAKPATEPLPSPDLRQITLIARLATIQAYASLGQASAALIAIDNLDKELTRQGITDWVGRIPNFRAWVLRGLGRDTEADESNCQALEEARRDGAVEAEANALFDLTDGCLRRGDLESALSYLSATEPLQSGDYGGRWRNALRDRLFRGRAALLGGQVERAHEIAAELKRDAQAAGSRRHAAFASLLRVRTAIDLGEPIDHAAV
ncbi:MAG TPA: BREX system ATP-binding domain-containing protein, partial [Chloroflexota bacterium]|nr:BREX system ATP-binding domain-containing protein [Chloroflexota bacterium]